MLGFGSEMAASNQGDMFDAYFRRADLDRDGRISGAEAVAFFQGSNLPKQVLAQIWTYADQNRAGYLGRAEFYNALKLVTVAQSKRELTPEIVRAALYGPASAKIPAPQISLPSTVAPQSGAAGAAPPSQVGAVTPTVSQNPGFRGVPVNPTTNMIRPPTAVSGVAALPVQGVGFQGFPGGAPPMGPNVPNAGVANNAGGATAGGASAGMLSDRGNGHLMNHTGLPSATPGPMTSLPTKQPVASLVTSSGSSIVLPKQPVSQNGVASGSVFGGDAFSAAASQPKRDGLLSASSGGIFPVSSAPVPVSASTQTLSRQGSLDSVPNSLTSQPVSGQLQKTQSFLKQNQQAPVRSIYQSGSPAMPSHSSAGHQPQLQWPRPTQTDVQKYTKVFMEVDTDKDGKITGEQARNLFLNWGLPREVLKQVWDLSDQDNDSMLSLREFCVALYLMERYREGRPLPAALPSNILLDFPATPQPTGGYGNAAWGPQPGLRQPQGMPGGGARPTARPPGKPPLPVPAASADDRLPPKPQRAKVPVLEKHLLDQLSEEEQNSLNLKFQEASDANKKVEELEKEIKDAREKIEFYRVKMQELVIYKSRCDSRFNEVTERAAADKREVEVLAKKYEEKYRQAGDVASKLTIEEATFRDIQEKKMEMYQAIVKMEQDGSDENLQARADRIQSSLDELVKSLSERCKKYGLRAKPTTLLELPFGWQPGIQAGAADWTEDWDKLDDEGFTFVKELTLDVQNVVAPPKTQLKLPKKEKSSGTEGGLAIDTSDVESKPSKPGAEGGQVVENGVIGNQKEDGTVRSPHGSPSARSFHGSPRDGPQDNHFDKSLSSNASPRAKKTHSDLGVEDAFLSSGKSFDGSAWGNFDTNDDVDSAWGPSKEMDHDRHSDDLFGHGGWTLPPIKTGPSQTDSFLPKKSIFDDSVPSTPAEGFLPKKSIFADSVPGTPADGFLPKKSVFADSVPSTPLFSSSYSPKKYGEGTSESGFNFSRFDSFRSTDSGFQPQERLTRFDSIGSTRDFDAQDVGSFQRRETFQRFDSMRSTNDFDYGRQSSSFDDSDPFGSGPFRSSFGNETPRGVSDAFGSGGHFRSSLGSETPRSEVDPFRSVGPFGSSMTDETPRADPDPFGSDGPFRSTWGRETPRRDEDPFGSTAPFSSLGSETPRRESDYFAHSGSFRSSFGSETPSRDFDSFGFGGPFGSSSLGSETPRRDSDQFGASGSFNYSVSGETPRGGTDSWRAF